MSGVCGWMPHLLWPLSLLHCSVIMTLSTYTGEVESGLRHGQGTYRCSVTGSTYVGQWVSGRRQGHGRLKYRSTGGEEGACYYNGDWVDNQQKGFGTRRYRCLTLVVVHAQRNTHIHTHTHTHTHMHTHVIVAWSRRACMAMHGCHACPSGPCNYFVIQSTAFTSWLVVVGSE